MKNLEFESYFELNYQKGDFLDKSISGGGWGSSDFNESQEEEKDEETSFSYFINYPIQIPDGYKIVKNKSFFEDKDNLKKTLKQEYLQYDNKIFTNMIQHCENETFENLLQNKELIEKIRPLIPKIKNMNKETTKYTAKQTRSRGKIRTYNIPLPKFLRDEHPVCFPSAPASWRYHRSS